MSRRATSGVDATAAPVTSSPRDTWATTSISGSRLRRLASAVRTIVWSSARSTRITLEALASRARDRHRDGDREPEPAAVERAGHDRPVEGTGALGQSRDSVSARHAWTARVAGAVPHGRAARDARAAGAAAGAAAVDHDAAPIIDHLNSRVGQAGADPERAVAGAAVPDHVGRAFADG